MRGEGAECLGVEAEVGRRGGHVPVVEIAIATGDDRLVGRGR